jgi:hypothetical protein
LLIRDDPQLALQPEEWTEEVDEKVYSSTLDTAAGSCKFSEVIVMNLTDGRKQLSARV